MAQNASKTQPSAWSALAKLVEQLNVVEIWEGSPSWALPHLPLHAETRANLTLRVRAGEFVSLANVLEHILDPARFCGTEPVEQWARAELWQAHRRTHRDALRVAGRALEAPPEVGMSRHHLEAWAAAHDLSDWLDLPVGGWLEGAAVWDGQISFAELICGELLGEETEWSTMQQTDALRFLEERAAERPQVERDELLRARRRKPPRRATLRALYDELLQLRQTLRLQVGARSVRAVAQAELAVIEPPVQLVYEEHCAAHCGDGRLPARVDVRVRNDGLSLRCRCLQGGHRPCAVKLSALDAMLDFLGAPSSGEALDTLARLLETPVWVQTLDALSHIVQQETRLPDTLDNMPAHFGWRIESSSPSELTLHPAMVRERKRGSGSVTRRLALERALRARAHLDLRDRELLELLAALSSDNASRLQQQRQNALLLSRLVLHPHVFLMHHGRSLPLEVIRHRVTLQASPLDDETLHLALALDGKPLAVERIPGLLASAETGGVEIRLETRVPRLELIEVPEAVARAFEVLERFGERLPQHALPQLLERAGTLTAHGALELAPQLRGAPRSAAFGPCLRLRFDAGTLHAEFRIRPLAGGPAVIPGQGPETLYGLEDEQPVHVQRDFAQEGARARELLSALGLEERAHTHYTWMLEQLDEALALVSRARALEDRLELLWDSAPLSVVASAGAEQLRVHIQHDRGWFQVGGALEWDGHVLPLDQLLEAVRDRHRYVPLGEGAWMELEERLVQHLQRLGDLPEKERRVDPLTAQSLVALEACGAQLHGEATEWLEMTERIRAAETLQPPVPETLQAELRPYQVEGFQWLARLASWAPGACLADDMGLGKTLQTLALLLHNAERGPALVIAPTSVCFNWRREAQRFAPTLQVLPISSQDELGHLAALAPGALVITTYDMLSRHIGRFHLPTWSTLVLDEAQAIKNPRTRRARAVYALKARFRLALTGTPLQNRTSELWSLFRATLPGLLGSARDFRERFARPIEREGDARARETLTALISPFLLRRLKADVASELPPRTDVRIDVELSPAERSLYNTFRRSVLAALRAAELEGDASQRFKILAAITRLRQLACHPRLFDPASRIHASKLAQLRELVGRLRAEDHRALIFSQFTAHLALVREALERDGVRVAYLDGSLIPERRQRIVDAFQAGEHDVFLLSIKAGGTGLNLTAADYVVHLDPWWNPAVEEQATNRAHRIGQERPVTVYRLVTVDTIEEAIYDLHAEKRALLEGLLDGTASTQPMSVDELRALIELRAPPEPSLEAHEAPRRPPRRSTRAAHRPAPQVQRPRALTASELQLERALERFERRLEAAYAAGEIAMDATVRNYRIKGQRMLEWMLEQDRPLEAHAVRASLDDYLSALERGLIEAPTSDYAVAPNVARYLAASLDARGSEEQGVEEHR